MKAYAPDMAFRGTRTYLHSTDLYEHLLVGAVETGLGAVDGAVRLKIRRRLVHQPELCYLTGDEAVEPAGGEFFVTAGGRRTHGVVRETTRSVSARKAYDEQPIWNASSIHDRVLKGRAPDGAAPIEVVTALGVLHHRTLFPPSAGRRWMLARIDLEHPLTPADVRDVELVMRPHVGGRMTRSAITGSGTALGTMEFILADA